MPQSHQTIKLSRGKHKSPAEGACVMELASMLSGERFNDHPSSVCPVIGAVLRTYNDSVDDDARQKLYSYAARVVGSRATPATERARADHLRSWAREVQGWRWGSFLLRCRLRPAGWPEHEVVAAVAVGDVLRRPGRGYAVLALIEDLLAITPEPLPRAASSPVSGDDSLSRGGEPLLVNSTRTPAGRREKEA